jgi:hypothetical protein
MASGFLDGVRRFILWDYARATWQYDVMVAVILAFIFLTPRGWFRDQPRIPRASSVARLPANHGGDVFWIEPQLLEGVPAPQRIAKAAEILKTYTGKQQNVTRLEAVYNSEEELTGFMVFARP